MNKLYSRSVSLVELVLILAILIFLTGVAVKLYPDLGRKAKLTANFQNFQNVYNASLLFEAETSGSLPNLPDSLLTVSLNRVPLFNEGPGTTAVLVGSNPSNVASEINGGTPITSADVLLDFNNRGLNTLLDKPDTAIHASFDVGTSRTLQDVATTEFLIFDVNDVVPAVSIAARTHLNQLFNLNLPVVPAAGPPALTSVYLCLGIGSSCSLVGTTNLNFAPVHIPDAPTTQTNIETHYYRYVNVYEISAVIPPIGDPYIRVKFLGTVHPNEFDSASSPAPDNDMFVSVKQDYEKIQIEYN